MRERPLYIFTYIWCTYLGGHTDWSLHLEVLLLSSTDKVCTYLLQRLDVAAGEGDTDAMDGNLSLNRGFTGVLERLQVQ